jgi:micrococcal nuclease
MRKKNKYRSLIAFICIILFALAYSPIDNFLEEEFGQTSTGFVTRIVDGDTIELQTGEHVRLLGINTPEKGEEYYTEAKKFLEEQILNKTVNLKFGKQKTDLYNRTLAYVFFQGENINQKIISNGFANAYFPSGKDTYFSVFIQAWEECVEKNLNYCEKSKNICASCITLKELNYNGQKVVLKNTCGISCNLTNWKIKDEGRKEFTFPEFILESNEKISVIVGENEVEGTLIWNRKDYVWTKSGDTLFLRDNQNKLVLWENY